MDEVKKLLETTEMLVELTKNPKQSNRDETIRQIETMLSKREELMNKLQPPFSTLQMEFGKKIVSLNQTLAKQLEQFKQQIKKDIIFAKNNKATLQKYMNPYGNATIDGIFYDKRK